LARPGAVQLIERRPSTYPPGSQVPSRSEEEITFSLPVHPRLLRLRGPGIKPKKANKAGSATFNLGSLRGEFSYYVEAGVYDDLFWEGPRATFRL
jgi:hypothetical protein